MNCQICNTESTVPVCESCIKEAKEARVVKDENERIAAKVGESIGRGMFNVTKWVCKGVQCVTPIVGAATEASKKAWNEAKSKEDK